MDFRGLINDLVQAALLFPFIFIAILSGFLGAFASTTIPEVYLDWMEIHAEWRSIPTEEKEARTRIRKLLDSKKSKLSHWALTLFGAVVTLGVSLLFLATSGQ